MDVPRGRSGGGFEVADVEAAASAGAGEARQSVIEEFASLVALSYLCFWHIGIQATFIATSWWNFFDPANLGMSIFGAVTMALPCWMLPLLLEVGPLRRLLSAEPWLFAVVLPALLLFLNLHFGPRPRTLITGICAFCGCTGSAVCLADARGKPLAKLFPWAVVIGTLLLQCVKYAFASMNPVTDEADGFLAVKVAGAVLAVASAGLLRYLLGATGPGSQTSSNCCAVLAVAPALAGGLTLNVALMSNPGMLAKYAGYQPFPGGILVPCFLILGVPLAFALQGRPSRAAGVAALGLVLGAALLAGTASCRGEGHCGGWNTFAGGAILAAVMPVLWVAVSAEASLIARAGAAGRLFALAGFLVFIYIQLYLSVVTSLPLDQSGREGLWLWVVAAPAAAGLLAAVPLQGWSAVKGGRGVSAAALACSVVAVAVLALVPAVAYRWDKAAISITPSDPAQWTAMSFNVQGGYTTNGQWNGECVVDILRRYRPDHVAFPEGEGMRFHTGNRDHIDWYATQWGAYADFGPPSWAGGAGVAAAGTRKPHDVRWHSMPKEPGNMNRFLLQATYDFQGIQLTVFSTHAEWFGDPLVQTRFIASKAKAAAALGPVMLLGDFNVEPNGANNNAPNASSLAVISDGGLLRSATPVACGGEKPLGHLCRSPFATASIDTHCNPCEGYQLDYIFYTPRWLDIVPGSVHSVDDSLPGGGWCSDHRPLVATFRLSQEALTLPRVL